MQMNPSAIYASVFRTALDARTVGRLELTTRSSSMAWLGQSYSIRLENYFKLFKLPKDL